MAGRKSCSKRLDFCLLNFENGFAYWAHPSRCFPHSSTVEWYRFRHRNIVLILILDTGFKTKSEKSMTPAPP